MNKKLVKTVGSLALVGVIGVGATLAYLSAETGTLTNKFVFTQHGIQMSLDEAKINDNNEVTDHNERVPAGQSQIYDELQPGDVLPKDPTVTITKGSEDCYVVVAVTNANGDNLTTGAIGDKWVELTNVENAKPNTKYYRYSEKVVTSDTQDNVLQDVFETVKVSNDLSSETTFTDIEIKAAAAQAENVEESTAIQNALDLLLK